MGGRIIGSPKGEVTGTLMEMPGVCQWSLAYNTIQWKIEQFQYDVFLIFHILTGSSKPWNSLALELLPVWTRNQWQPHTETRRQLSGAKTCLWNQWPAADSIMLAHSQSETDYTAPGVNHLGPLFFHNLFLSIPLFMLT